MQTRAFFDALTSTLTYVVWDEATRDAVVIDPVLDYDPVAVRVSERSLDEVTGFIAAESLTLRMVLETHAHADHISGAQRLRERFGAPVGIGARITRVQEVFKEIFDLGDDFATDGSQFDLLFEDGETFWAGSLRMTAINTPGHTPACVCYLTADSIFTGDAMFMPDFGTGRCDFPEGSAQDLYESITTKLYTLPEETRVFVGHDYQPGGRELAYETTIGDCKQRNCHLDARTDKERFVQFREQRDRTLSPPKLLFPSVQINVDAGVLPRPSSNGRRYMKLPIGFFD